MNPLSFQLLATLNSSLHCAGVCSPKMLPAAISALDPGPGLRRWSVFWPFVTLCHLVTLCDTLWQCNTVTGGVLRRHRVVTWPRVAAALVSVPPLATIVTTRHWHSDISSFSFIVTIRVNIVWEYKVQATKDELKTLIVTVNSVWKLGICHCWNILRVGLQ